MKHKKRTLITIAVLVVFLESTACVSSSSKLSHEEQVITSSTAKEPTLIEPQQELEEIEVTTVDYQFEALVNATFNLETGYGTSDLWVYNNNAGGYKCNGSPNEQCTQDNYRIFDAKYESILALRELLIDYVNTYGYDLQAIRSRYCENCGESDLNTFTELYYKELEALT